MAFAIAPLGYRRYEPTPNGTDKNNAKFLKHESQIPLTDYEAQREFGTDLIENFVKILNEERYRDGIPTGNWVGSKCTKRLWTRNAMAAHSICW